MARPATHQIELSQEDRTGLERIARAEKLPWRGVQGAKIVLYCAGGRATWTSPGLDTSAGIVGRWRRRSKDSRTGHARGAAPFFPAEQVAEVKAIACELPAVHGLPLGRLTRTELHRLVIERAVLEASASTFWRRLHDDLIRLWQQRSWLFMRGPTSPPRPRRCSTSSSGTSKGVACPPTST